MPRKKKKPVPLTERQRLDHLFLETILGSYEIEARANKTAEYVESRIQEEGISSSFDPKKFLTYMEKLTDLWTLSVISQGMGLGNYTDQIMTQEIQRLFPVKVQQQDETKPKGNSQGTS